jgi:serine/threonine-protein kinase RsbW
VLSSRDVSGGQIIRLEVPGLITFRDVVLRATSAACKLVASGDEERDQLFATHLVSAVGEAFNNIALHGYRGRPADVVRLQLEVASGYLRVTLEDFGASFDPHAAPPPDLAALPESGMGIFIMRSFVDEISYQDGRPNVLTFLKRTDGAADAAP